MKQWYTLLILLYLAIGSGFLRIIPQSDHRQFFDKDAPELTSVTTLQQQYGSTESVLIVLVSDTDSILSQPHLLLLQNLQDSLATLPHLETLESLLTLSRFSLGAFNVTKKPLVAIHFDTVSSNHQKEVKEILAMPLYRGNVIDSSQKATALSLTFRLDSLSEEEVQQLRDTIRVIVQSTLSHSSLHSYITGGLYINEAFTAAGIHDSQTLTPLMVLLFITLIALLYRSFKVVLFFSIVVFTAPLIVMGIAGWLLIPFSPSLAVVPIIALTITTATVIHLLARYQEMLYSTTSSLSPSQALAKALTTIEKPLLYTALTTIVGFLTLNMSKTPPFRVMGNLAALSTVIAFLHARFLLPLLFSLGHYPTIPPQRAYLQRLENRLTHLVTHHTKKIILLFLIALSLSFNGLFHLKADDQFINYFDHSNPFRHATDSATTYLGGIDYLQVSIASPTNLEDSLFLSRLDTLATYIEELDIVRSSVSLPQVISHHYSLMTIPQSFAHIPHAIKKKFIRSILKEQNNQKRPLISANGRETQIFVIFNQIRSTELLATAQAIHTQAIQLFNEESITIGSTPLLFAQLSVSNSKQMNQGMILSLILITALLIGVTRRFLWGVITMIPNTLPVLIALGLWGILVGKSGLGLSIVAPMSLGIIVDDTVHFITHYSSYRKSGNSCKRAIEMTYRDITGAVITTTVVLTLGFLTLTISGFAPTREMGLVTAITIVLALAGDLLLLPALLLLFDRKKIS